MVNTDPDCRFCDEGNLVVLHETKNLRLVQVVKSGSRVPGAFLAIAKEHIAPDEAVKFNPHNEVLELRLWLRKEQRAFDIDNYSLNLTRKGGVQVPGHMHFWLLDREVIRSYFWRRGIEIPDKGMYGLIEALYEVIRE